MTTPPKPRASGARTSSGRAALRLAKPALDKASEALRDPKTRALLIEQGQKLADAGQRWAVTRRQERKDDAGPGLAARLGASAGQMFGQKKLERRVVRLRAAITAVTEGRTELDRALEPVSLAIEEVAANLTISAALPVGKRKRAHFRIDRQLDRLENDLFESTFDRDSRAEATSSATDDEVGGT